MSYQSVPSVIPLLLSSPFEMALMVENHVNQLFLLGARSQGTSAQNRYDCVQAISHMYVCVCVSFKSATKGFSLFLRHFATVNKDKAPAAAGLPVNSRILIDLCAFNKRCGQLVPGQFWSYGRLCASVCVCVYVLEWKNQALARGMCSNCTQFNYSSN